MYTEKHDIEGLALPMVSGTRWGSWHVPPPPQKRGSYCTTGGKAAHTCACIRACTHVHTLPTSAAQPVGTCLPVPERNCHRESSVRMRVPVAAPPDLPEDVFPSRSLAGFPCGACLRRQAQFLKRGLFTFGTCHQCYYLIFVL